MENPEGGDSPPPPDLLGARASPLAAAGALRSAPLAAAGAPRSAPLAAGAPRSAPLAAAGALRSAPQHAAAAPSSSAAGALRSAAGASVAAGAPSSTSAAAPMFAAPDLGFGQPDLGMGAQQFLASAAGHPSLYPQASNSAAAGAPPGLVGAPRFVAAADLGVGHAGYPPTFAAGSYLGKGAHQPLSPAAGGVLGGAKGAQQPSSSSDGTHQPSSSSDGAQPPVWGTNGASAAQLLFKNVLLAARLPAIPVAVHAPAATDSGRPAAFFSTGEVQASCSPMEYVLMAKTPLGRPPFQLIREHLSQRFKLEKEFILCPYDGRHLMIRMGCKEDFLKLLLKDTTYIQGKIFRFLKWDIDFSPASDSPLVPVWLEMPRLPANFFCEPMLRSIAGSIGPILQIAQCTLNLTMAHAAAVCVQLDVSQPLPDSVWIGIGAGGFWQPVEYPNPPRFCTACNRIGHVAPDCKQVPPSDAPKKQGQQGAGSKGTHIPPTAEANTRIWRPAVARTDAPKQTKTAAQAKNPAHQVLGNMPQTDLPHESRNNSAQVSTHGVYLTPMKTCADQGGPETSSSHAGSAPPTTSALLGSQRPQHHADAPVVPDGMGDHHVFVELPQTQAHCTPAAVREPDPLQDGFLVPELALTSSPSIAPAASSVSLVGDNVSAAAREPLLLHTPLPATIPALGGSGSSEEYEDEEGSEESEDDQEEEEEEEEEEELPPPPPQPPSSIPQQVTPAAKPNEGAAQSEESEDEEDEEEDDVDTTIKRSPLPLQTHTPLPVTAPAQGESDSSGESEYEEDVEEAVVDSTVRGSDPSPPLPKPFANLDSPNSVSLDEEDPSDPPPSPDLPPPAHVVAAAHGNLIIGLPAQHNAAPARGTGRAVPRGPSRRGPFRKSRGTYYGSYTDYARYG